MLLVALHGGERLAPSSSGIRFLCNLLHAEENGHIVDTLKEDSHDLSLAMVLQGGVT